MFIKKLEESQMDKILEKLAGVLTAEDLQEIKESFESAVEERLKVKLAEETDSLTKKADEFCKQKIKEAVDKKTAELEDLANKYCEERCAKIALKEQEKLNAQCKKLEEAAEQYIYEFFDEKFTEKYGQELQALEEKVITGLDKYLEYNISEKINDKLITKTAMSETYAPIIEVIQHLFEDQYVPMDLTGSKKLREAKAENAELQKSLKKQLAENMRLIDLVEDSNKKATIAEKKNTLASLQNQYAQLAAGNTYQEVADATVTSANLKIDALQKESDALINQANNLEYVARMWALYNQAKMGEITPEQYQEAKSKVKFGNQKAQKYEGKVETKTITLNEEQRIEKMNALQEQIDKLSGGMIYDSKTREWTGKTHIGEDGQLHFDEGEIATWEHLGYKIQDMLDSGKLTQSSWKKAYRNPQAHNIHLRLNA